MRSRARSTRSAESGVEVAVVIGAGNIYRGMAAAAEGMDRATADYAGMLATLLNCLDGAGRAREARRRQTRVMSAITVSARWPSRTSAVARSAISRRAASSSSPCGTGNPFFTTDTAAALRALEINAEALLMGKNGVDGVYDGDPRLDPSRVLPARADPPGRDRARPAGHGHDRALALHGQRAADLRLRPRRRAQHRAPRRAASGSARSSRPRPPDRTIGPVGCGSEDEARAASTDGSLWTRLVARAIVGRRLGYTAQEGNMWPRMRLTCMLACCVAAAFGVFAGTRLRRWRG